MLLGMAPLIVASIGCGGSSADSPSAAALKPPLPNHFERISLKGCSGQQVRHWPHGGGYDVHLAGVSCNQAAELVPKLGDPLVRGGGTTSLLDRGNGWICWGELVGDGGPVQEVCWRGRQVISFKAA
jgi:hypothetical protein